MCLAKGQKEKKTTFNKNKQTDKVLDKINNCSTVMVLIFLITTEVPFANGFLPGWALSTVFNFS